MSKIGELISNIHQYGNSKLYMQSQNPNVNRVLEFSVDDDGNLNVVGKLEVFDKPFWNGSKIDESAIMIRSIESCQFSKKDLDMNIAVIVLSTFYYSNLPIMAKQEVPTNVNTDKAANVIYQMANSMLQLSNAELTHWVLGRDNDIENMLINKASQSIVSDDIKPVPVLIDNIENQVKDVNARLTNVHNVWKEMNNSRTEDEYKVAGEKWDSLYNDKSEKKLF